MTNRNDMSSIQVSLLKELFEAHLGPIREDVKAIRSDMRIEQAAIRTDLGAVHKRTEEAHDEIAKYRNRAIGFGATLGLGGGGVGAFLAKHWPTLFS